MHLFKSIIEYITYVKAEQIRLHIMKVIESDSSSVNPFYFTPNVLLFSCNLIELCILLQRKFNFLSSYTDKIQTQVSTIAAGFIESIEDEYILRALVFEKNFDDRDSLSIFFLSIILLTSWTTRTWKELHWSFGAPNTM